MAFEPAIPRIELTQAEQHIAAESDALLRAIDQGWRPPCSSRALADVRYDALIAVARLPDPVDVARALEAGEPDVAETLRQAYIGQRQPNAGWWRVDEHPTVRVLRCMGLVEIGDFGLTAFGNSVRKILLGDIP